ncbi:hypothetical protein K488DRAFT_64932 [Vararia minispora EC-137]|uniref:Uncharacterized protein n=1 Tax=Vararia minispora EC-137 TaxID=1314806 RepID=A0ACB8Q534_9AGAM|nr:hypothetical protein K488DRAFT_64932 [Vararia minispora EC-137]
MTINVASAEAVTQRSRAVTVFCASSPGNDPAFRAAATSVGRALATTKRALVYGGGSKGLMGLVSAAVIEGGGDVTGVVPDAMLKAGGEDDKTRRPDDHGAPVIIEEAGRENVKTIVVGSMHERKVEMAQRAGGFIGLPGGFGTFEEVLEVITWTQLGIHSKPVILINVHGFWDPLRALIRGAVAAGFIRENSQGIVIFIDGPLDRSQHASYDWGAAAMFELEHWGGAPPGFYRWQSDGQQASLGIEQS